MAKNTNTRSGSSSTSRPTANLPLPATRQTAAYVRLAHPTRYGVYFKQDDAVNPWVERGYTRWIISEWEGKFGGGVNDGSDNRKWDFFGFVIPLYDDNRT